MGMPETAWCKMAGKCLAQVSSHFFSNKRFKTLLKASSSRLSACRQALMLWRWSARGRRAIQSYDKH